VFSPTPILTLLYHSSSINAREKSALLKIFYPPSQKATGVNPWMNAKRVTLRAYSAEVASATKAGSLGEGGYASAGFAEVCEDATAVKPWSFTLNHPS